MKKIKSVMVMGEKVKIRWVKRMPEGHDHQAAYYDIDLKEIVICDTGDEEHQFKTLVHEIIHCYQNRMGFLQEQSLAPFLEVQAESLSNLIFDLFKFR